MTEDRLHIVTLAGMTVNERLFALGQLDAFERQLPRETHRASARS